MAVVCTTPPTALLGTTPAPAVEELDYISYDAFFVILHGELHSVLFGAYCSLHSSVILTGTDNRDRKIGLLASPFLPKMICRV
ncbi:hypothetical protein BDQ94DRAFT_164185 [Aspergillus welwitschiae]|uniref:Uncharacterized protein n=1 Tax=Aspergillus welwitschiae TaxID=1341132 RepID=A0A3F3PIP1_9EURO|nr:hypothetical protein BDQ94DRAFT_164185 [Aspergillus welwitschiae]RDH26805.1 hypothetical protein BDQ94DRAFT_164185 [Aspergillus welwitschiae]